MSKMKFYAVLIGKVPGIYTDWGEAEKSVKGFRGAKHKSFATRREAEEYMGLNEDNVESKLEGENEIEIESVNDSENKLIIYTDGSSTKFKKGFEHETGGYGFVYTKSERGKEKFLESSYGPVISSKEKAHNDVAELYAIYKALRYGHKNKLFEQYDEVIVKSDCKYAVDSFNLWIKKWSRNNWNKSDGTEIKNKELIIKIYRYVILYDIKFIHVRAHMGNEFNELADRLADKGRRDK